MKPPEGDDWANRVKGVPNGAPFQKKMREKMERSLADRKAFLEIFSEILDAKPVRNGNTILAAKQQACASVGHSIDWMLDNGRRHPEFHAARKAIERGESLDENMNRITGSWDGTFGGFRNVFLGRNSPWYHERIARIVDTATPGSIHLIITPPEHGKTSLLEDHVTYRLCKDASTRILYGHSQIDQAKKSVGVVKSRLEPGMDNFAMLQREFGPFAPDKGVNKQGLPQVWTAGEFNVYSRALGEERDFSMRALGMNSNVAGTRTDLMYIDDAQERKTLNLTPKIMESLRDDWFLRPGAFGVTIIVMNVVGDGDIAEELIRSDTCDSVTILKAFDEAYRDLGPRKQVDGTTRESPWLWCERYDEAAYERLKRKAGQEGWARKYQQDWRPATTRSFTQSMIEKCSNAQRSVLDVVPKHPGGGPAEIAVSLDPGFTRAAVSVAAFEPTVFRLLDTVSLNNARTLTQQIDLLEDRIRAFHKPPVSRVKFVTVETKAFQLAIVKDDAFCELRDEIGFEVVEFQTDWKKNDNDYGITQMARSMERGEFDFTAKDSLSKSRFDALYTELYNWRPSRGNQLVQDEVMAMWFNFVKWHKLRRKSIHRPTPTENFGFQPMPQSPITQSDWSFGLTSARR